jgi:hypothetical protein
MHVAPVSRFVRHEHLVVTVEADIKERIDADLDAGESLEAWVADAVEQKLNREAARPDFADAAETESSDSDSDSDADIIDLGEAGANSSESATPDHSPDDTTDPGDELDSGDEYDEGFEYVDDCAI